MKNIILGISAYYHDSAASIIVDGKIIAAASEERFTRIKGDSSFPHNAVGYCLDAASVTLDEANYIVFYEDSVLKFDRLITMSHLTSNKTGGANLFIKSMPKWLTQNIWINRIIAKELGRKDFHVLNCEHHVSHAASAFNPSPYDAMSLS